MPEYSTVIEVWFRASDDSAATDTAKAFREALDDWPSAIRVTVEPPEEQ